jgi:glutamyl-tRNA synthetase
VLVLRNEDIDSDRCRPHFVAAMLEDLRWFGCVWQEGPDRGGPFGPYAQSERRLLYVDAFRQLLAGGFIYPCQCSRRDVLRALGAPHSGEEEPVYPGTCRPLSIGAPAVLMPPMRMPGLERMVSSEPAQAPVNWRFRVPDGETVAFEDAGAGAVAFVAGRDFGDFVVWRHDELPSYQLAVTVDDALMEISEVVRGADLLLSTARQILIYRALQWRLPQFFHCPLVTDAGGLRLSKRHDALSLRALRATGATPEELRAQAPFVC